MSGPLPNPPGPRRTASPAWADPITMPVDRPGAVRSIGRRVAGSPVR